MKTNQLPKGVMPKIVHDYNCHFAIAQALQVTHWTAAKQYLPIIRLFNNKWHPQNMKDVFLSAFSLDTWVTLSEEEKKSHTVKNCKACRENFAGFSNSFPSPKKRGKTSSSAKNHSYYRVIREGLIFL